MYCFLVFLWHAIFNFYTRHRRLRESLRESSARAPPPREAFLSYITCMTSATHCSRRPHSHVTNPKQISRLLISYQSNTAGQLNKPRAFAHYHHITLFLGRSPPPWPTAARSKHCSVASGVRPLSRISPPHHHSGRSRRHRRPAISRLQSRHRCSARRSTHQIPFTRRASSVQQAVTRLLLHRDRRQVIRTERIIC